MRATWILRLQESLTAPRTTVRRLAKLPFEAKGMSRSNLAPPAETKILALNNLPPAKNELKVRGNLA